MLESFIFSMERLVKLFTTLPHSNWKIYKISIPNVILTHNMCFFQYLLSLLYFFLTFHFYHLILLYTIIKILSMLSFTFRSLFVHSNFFKIKMLIYKEKNELKSSNKINLEDPVGFEPTIRELQSHALPLGYGSIA